MNCSLLLPVRVSLCLNQPNLKAIWIYSLMYAEGLIGSGSSEHFLCLQMLVWTLAWTRVHCCFDFSFLLVCLVFFLYIYTCTHDRRLALTTWHRQEALPVKQQLTDHCLPGPAGPSHDWTTSLFHLQPATNLLFQLPCSHHLYHAPCSQQLTMLPCQNDMQETLLGAAVLCWHVSCTLQSAWELPMCSNYWQ